MNLFEGLPLIGFEGFIKKGRYECKFFVYKELFIDIMMQKIIIKDMLRVLQEKCMNFKNSITDKNRLQNVKKTRKCEK